MTSDQKKLIFSSLLNCNTYCPLIWMFCTKRFLSRINNIHERCLRLIQQNYRSEFERLLDDANEKLVHQKCIEFLLIKVYKYLKGLILWTLSLSSDKTPIISEISTHLNLKILEQISLAQIVLHTELVSFGIMFSKQRNSASLLIFKDSAKKAPLISCSCHCFKTYIHHAGYI